MNKEGATRAENQQRVDRAIDLAITAAPQIIGHCLQLNPGLDRTGNREAGAPYCRSRNATLKTAARVTPAVTDTVQTMSDKGSRGFAVSEGRFDLYRALKPDSSPRFDTIQRVCKVLGVRLVVQAEHG